MNIIQQLFRMAKFCMAVRCTHLWSMDIFNTNISRGSVAMHLRGWDILLSFYCKFIAKSVGERNLKIGQHLAKSAVKNIVAPFFRIRYRNNNNRLAQKDLVLDHGGNLDCEYIWWEGFCEAGGFKSQN